MIKSHNLKYYINKQKDEHSTCLFTDFARFPNYQKTIKNLPENSLIIFREYKLNPQKRQELALKIQKLAKKHRHKLIIGKNFDLAKKIKADGYHFSDFDHKNPKNHAAKLKNHQKNHNFIISLACHSLNSIKKAQNSTIELLFLSPVYHSTSHPYDKIHGIFGLIRSKTASKAPIFALGGIKNTNLHKIKSGGVAGIEIFQEN